MISQSDRVEAIVTSSFARSAISPLVCLCEQSGAGQLSVQSCCSPIVSASAATPRAIALVRFNCCSPFASASDAARHMHPLHLLLSIVSVSTAPRLHPLHLLLSIASVSTAPRLRPLQLLFPDCVCFNCCSPIVSDSTAAPRLHLLRLLLPSAAPASCSRQLQLHTDKHMVKILMY